MGKILSKTFKQFVLAFPLHHSQGHYGGFYRFVCSDWLQAILLFKIIPRVVRSKKNLGVNFFKKGRGPEMTS